MMKLKVIVSLFWCYLIVNISLANINPQGVPFDLNGVMEKVTHNPVQLKNQVREGEALSHRTDNRAIRKNHRNNDMNERTILNKRRHRSLTARTPEILQGEFLIDTTRICGAPSPNDQWSPSVAFDGTNFLVVWGDYNLEAVVGTRVTQNGEVLDTSGIIIAEADGDWEDEGPAIAFGNGNYFVVWYDHDYENILGVRVNPLGTTLDTTPIVICSSYFYRYQPSVTFSDSNYFVVWIEERDEYDIYGARVSSAGVVLDPASIPICWAYEYQEEPAVISGTDNYLVVWSDYRGDTKDIYGTRISGDGQVLDPVGIPISISDGSQSRPALSFDGNNYFVIWDDYRNGTDRDIYGARVTHNGMVLDSTGIAISTAFDYQWYPSVGFDGINYFAAWVDERTGYAIYGTRIDTGGIVLDTAGVYLSSSEGDDITPSLAFGSTNYLVAWSEYSSEDGNIFAARVDTNGTVLDTNGFLLTMQINSQYEPKVAFDGNNYLVVWADDRNGSDDIYGSRVSPEGIILDPGGIPISTANLTQTPCQIIFAGNQYLVIWTDYRNGNQDIYGARISTDGIVLDTAGISISTANDDQENPQVVFDGNNYFVIWQDRRNSYLDIYGARITLAGDVLEPEGIPISTATYHQMYPQVIFGGNYYFVVWEDARADYNDIYGARITLAGEVLEPDGIPISTATNYQYSPQVTYGGNTYFIVWEDNRGSTWDIYGARITLAGEVLEPDGIPISTATYYQHSPRVIFGGNNYFVVWKDGRNNNYYDIYGTRVTLAGVVLEPEGIPISTDTTNYIYEYPLQLVLSGNDYFIVWGSYTNGPFDIQGVRVNQAGVVIDSFVVSNQPGNKLYPALAAGNVNQVLIVYEGWTDEYQGNIYNTYRIWGKFYPFAPGIADGNLTQKMEIGTPLQIYPNPFNSQTTIRFSLSAETKPSLKIYDITGKLVKSFSTNDQLQKPNNTLVWDRTDDRGKNLPTGIYLCRLKTSEGNTETKQIVIMK